MSGGAFGNPCPYCGFQAADVWAEVAHMNARHPDIVRRWLRQAQIDDAAYVEEAIETGVRQAYAHLDVLTRLLLTERDYRHNAPLASIWDAIDEAREAVEKCAKTLNIGLEPRL